MTPPELANHLARLVCRYDSERDVCDALARLLEDLGVEVAREAQLGARERVDFLVQLDGCRVGVEVKVDGARMAVLRQLGRYAETGEVDALVLVTTKIQLGKVPGSIGRVPLYVAALVENCFV